MPEVTEVIVKDVDANTVRKTYILTGIFVVMAIFQWYFVQAYVRTDLSGYSTVLMMTAFALVTLFHLMPAIRNVYPYNYFFMLTTAELMILGAGVMTMKTGIGFLISLTSASVFIFMCLMIMGAALQRNLPPNPFCFLTTFFLSTMSVGLLVYVHLTLTTSTVLLLLNLLISYTIVAVVIYHSMVVHRRQARLYDDDYMLLGLLLFVDFICIYMLCTMYIQRNVKTGLRQCHCDLCAVTDKPVGILF